MKSTLYLLLSFVLFGCATEQEAINYIPATSNSNGLVIDVEGNEYQTVLIGNQEWMAENLKTSRYSNGDSIAYRVYPVLQLGSPIDRPEYGEWCWYEDNEDNELQYGKIYNSWAVEDDRNVCPMDWRIPTLNDWFLLISRFDSVAVDPVTNPSPLVNTSETAGGELKSIGTQLWLTPNLGATNESGFSGVPGGYVYFNGNHVELGRNGFWWGYNSESEQFSGFQLHYANTMSRLRPLADRTEYDFTIRCIKD